MLVGNEPVARRTFRASRASIVTDRLCGSTPITTTSLAASLAASMAALLASRSTAGQRGRATLFRAEQTLLEPRLAAVPGRNARQMRATPVPSQVGSRDESGLPGTYPRLTGQPGPGKKQPRVGRRAKRARADVSAM